MVLLIAGALPLMAEDDASTPPSTIAAAETLAAARQRQEEQQEQATVAKPQHDNEQEEQEGFGAAESLHDDSIAKLPRLPLNLWADVFEDEAFMLNASFDLYDKNSLRKNSQQEQAADAYGGNAQSKEPPDELTASSSSSSSDEFQTKGQQDELPSENNATTEKQEKEEEAEDVTNKTTSKTSDTTNNSTATATADTTSEEEDKANLLDETATNTNTNTTANTTAETDLHNNNTKDKTSNTTTTTNASTEGDSSILDNATLVDEDDEDTVILSERVAVDYASKSAGALILEKSSHFKGTSNLLNPDRDRYAIAPCNEKKFVVISLSEDILVKQIQLANYELYSSRVKNFQLQISQTMGNWIDMGTYTATPESGVQSIDLKEPAWGRYLKFKFKSHYGDEFYCTLSQILVHGSTMVQGFHEHLQESEDEEQEEEDDAATAEETEQQTKQEGTDDVKRNATNPESVMAGSSNATDSSTAAAAEDSIAEGGEKETRKKQAADRGAYAKATQASDINDASSSSDTSGSNFSNSTSTSKESEDLSDNATSSEDKEYAVPPHEEDGVNANEDDSSARWQSLIRRKSLLGDSRKDRNASDVLPSASIGLSSNNVYSTIIGRLEPLSSFHGFNSLSESLSTSNHPFNDILAKASDSTKKIRKAITDPAILEYLQLSSLNTMQQRQPNAFGSKEKESPEQALAEKLNAYILGSDDDHIKTIAAVSSSTSASDEQGANNEGTPSKFSSAGKKKKESTIEFESTDSSEDEGTDSASYGELHESDLALANLLDKLPSVECLKKLDYEDFKKKAMAARKGGHKNRSHGGKEQEAAVHTAEPIFKMLTDQIKSLQQSLSVHDQFTKEAVRCYQSVLLDVVVELQTMRMEHDARLTQLETDLQETKTIRWVFLLYQFITGIPNWISLLIATFFTSHAVPSVVSVPYAAIQSFLSAKYRNEGENAILSWTFTLCAVLIFVATTWALCQRLLSTIKVNSVTNRYSRRQKPNCHGTRQSCPDVSLYNASESVQEVKSPRVKKSHNDANAEQKIKSPEAINEDKNSLKSSNESTDKPAAAMQDLKEEHCQNVSDEVGKKEPFSPSSVAEVSNCEIESKPTETSSSRSFVARRDSEMEQSLSSRSLDGQEPGLTGLPNAMEHRPNLSVKSY